MFHDSLRVNSSIGFSFAQASMTIVPKN
jgi:hypothetical protein